ncbi:aminopeptidase Q isoform X2 [Microcaecilia unicolor]|uniref:Aminopeptidase n=1 Tax=Microcaecilia unicolor TaxID=1415580 RepID=A0A6P7XFD8_9AMPH|nr:aminopeptidase Q isoform X2 [Microcaecilia unicolor]
MGPTSSASGFYLSRATAALLALFLAALLLALTVLATLYARARLEAADPGSGAAAAASAAAVVEAHEPRSSPAPTVSANPDPSTRPGIWDNPRLPPSLFPVNYQLELWPLLEPDDEGRHHLSGQVNISARCAEDTDTVLLHSHKLNYSRAAVLVPPSGDGNSGGVTVRELWLAEEHQYVVLELREPLRAGLLYELQLDFTGFLSDDLTGLFVSYYEDFGDNKTLIASQLEPTFARSVYPCFDEPAMKATFNVRLVHPPDYVALSNMPAIATSEWEDTNGSKWTVTTFNTTLKMSTYITAFVVCDFDYVSRTIRGNEIRIWARKEVVKIGSVDFALNITGPIFLYLEELLNVSYPLTKTDIVALPNFGAGAMENWGLMTFQETSLVYNPSQKFSNTKALICLIISHEIGHQWFGNLVTMKWWNDIWLNEGFATYTEYLGASYIDPRLKLNELFLLYSLQTMFARDDFVANRPLSVKKEEIRLTTHIVPLFNMFTYIKGASFVRMISGFLTERLFTKGLSVIDEQNEIQLPTSLKNIMDTWTWGKGIPILTLNTSTGFLTEKQFYPVQDKQNTADNHTWIVPVSWIKNGYEQPLIWLDNRSKVFPEMQLSSEHEWIILNVNVTGYYRTNYDQLNWDRLALQLEKDPKAIPVANRVQLIDDAFTMAMYGYIEIETALSITKYLAKEEEIIVWYTVLKIMLNFGNFMSHKSLPLLKKYILKRISPIYHYYESLIQGDFDTTADDFFVQTTLETIIREACAFGLQDCLQLATDLYQRWMKDPSNNKIPLSIRRPIYCYGIAMGSEKEWEFAWEMYKKSSSNKQKNDLIYGLSCTREPWLLYRYLQNALGVSDFVAVDIFSSVARNEIGRFIAWEFMTANWEQINSQFEEYDSIYNSVLRVIIERVSTDLQFQEVKMFINIALDEAHKVVVIEQLENARNIRMQWRNKVDTTVYEWLRKNTVDSEL